MASKGHTNSYIFYHNTHFNSTKHVQVLIVFVSIYFCEIFRKNIKSTLIVIINHQGTIPYPCITCSFSRRSFSIISNNRSTRLRAAFLSRLFACFSYFLFLYTIRLSPRCTAALYLSWS